MTPILATLFDFSYATKGLALIRSLQTHHADGFRLYVLALDEATAQAVKGLSDGRVIVIPLAQVVTGKVILALADRTTAESCWTLASVFTQYCLETLNLPHVAYADADTYLFHPLDALYREVARASVAITPHRFSEARAKTHGVNGTYNVGWVYFRNDATGRACLDEWTDLCLEWCYQRSEQDERGVWRFGDQKYFDELVPKYAAHVVNNLGVNLAPWNCENYEYERAAGDGQRLFVIERCADGNVRRIDTLALYHFHGLEVTPTRGGLTFKRGGYKLPAPIGKFVYEPYEDELRRITRELGSRQ